MVMPHHLLPVGLPPASVAMAVNQMSQLSSLANMAAVSQLQAEEGKVIANIENANRDNPNSTYAKMVKAN